MFLLGIISRCQCIILYPAIIPFKNKNEIKILAENKQTSYKKCCETVKNRPEPKEILKADFQDEEILFQMLSRVLGRNVKQRRQMWVNLNLYLIHNITIIIIDSVKQQYIMNIYTEYKTDVAI